MLSELSERQCAYVSRFPYSKTNFSSQSISHLPKMPTNTTKLKCLKYITSIGGDILEKYIFHAERFAILKEERRVQKGWLAALVDGEGSIGINIVPNVQKKLTLCPAVGMSNKNRDILECLKDLTTVGSVWGPSNGLYQFGATHNSAYVILDLIAEFSIVKQPQIEILYVFRKHRARSYNPPYTVDDLQFVLDLRDLHKRKTSWKNVRRFCKQIGFKFEDLNLPEVVKF